MTSAVEIVAIFALMFTGIAVAGFWFAHSTSKMENKREIQKKKIEVIDRHFREMMRVECPYCQVVYKPTESECPNCGAKPVKIHVPEIPG